MPAIFSMKWPFHEITAKCFDLKNELWLFRGFQHLRKNTKFKLRGIQKCNDRASHLNGQWTDERREKKRGRGGHGQRRERGSAKRRAQCLGAGAVPRPSNPHVGGEANPSCLWGGFPFLGGNLGFWNAYFCLKPGAASTIGVTCSAHRDQGGTG